MPPGKARRRQSYAHRVAVNAARWAEAEKVRNTAAVTDVRRAARSDVTVATTVPPDVLARLGPLAVSQIIAEEMGQRRLAAPCGGGLLALRREEESAMGPEVLGGIVDVEMESSP